MTKRLKPEIRKQAIVEAAAVVALEYGFTAFTAAQVSERAGCSMRLVKHYYGTMPQLKRDVMRYAVTSGNAPLVAMGLAANDRHAQKAPAELKDQAADWLRGRVC